MRRHVQRGDVAGLVLARGRLQTLGLQHPVNVLLDLVKFGLLAADADAPP